MCWVIIRDSLLDFPKFSSHFYSQRKAKHSGCLRKPTSYLGLTSLHLAADGSWTHDLVLTKDALYLLSYSSDIQHAGQSSYGRPGNKQQPSLVRQAGLKTPSRFILSLKDAILQGRMLVNEAY
jgi:hypothetical protein